FKRFPDARTDVELAVRAAVNRVVIRFSANHLKRQRTRIQRNGLDVVVGIVERKRGQETAVGQRARVLQRDVQLTAAGVVREIGDGAGKGSQAGIAEGSGDNIRLRQGRH